MSDKLTVLSVEDNPSDFILIEKALNRIPGVNIDVINVDNGKCALDFLYKKEKYKKVKTPNIIILDINLPGLDGKEVLRYIKSDKRYKSIPVIIFSSSDYYKDIEEAFSLHANSYLTKTFCVQELYDKIELIGEYWLKSNKLPDSKKFLLND